MLKNLRLLAALITVISIASSISSCKDEEPTPPRISLASVDPISVSESAGTIEVEVVLDKAYSKDLTIEYTLEGTAVDIETATNPALADYQIAGGSGEVDIDKGETSGIIKIQITNDQAFEANETIIVHLDEVEDEPTLEITNDDEVIITLENDDEQVVASITTTPITVNESDGVDENGELQRIELTVTLDKPAPTNLVVDYTLGGTAIDTVTGFEEEIPGGYWDYYIHGTSGEVSIPAGQSSGKIEVQVYTDFVYEDTDTIEVTLKASESVQVSENKTAFIYIEQQDGKGIQLDWEGNTGNADMDLFLFILDENDEPVNFAAWSTNPGNTPRFELVFIPELVDNARFGLGYTYHSGNADPLTFRSSFVDIVDGVPEDEASWDVYSATYTAINKNPWDDQNNGTFPPAVVQTLSITDGVYTISEIAVPNAGSRVKTNKNIHRVAKSKAFGNVRLLKK